MDLEELKKYRRLNIEKDPKGVIFISAKKNEEKIEFSIAREEIRFYTPFSDALDIEEEKTTGWSKKKIMEEPYPVAVIELNLSNNIIAAIIMFIHKYYPFTRNESSSIKTTDKEIKEEKKEIKEEKKDVYQFFLKYQKIMSPILDSLWKDGFYGIGSALLTSFQYIINPLFDYLMGYIFFLCEGVPTSRLPEVINWDAKQEDRASIEKIKFDKIDCDEFEEEPISVNSIHFGDYSTKENIIASQLKEKQYANIPSKELSEEKDSYLNMVPFLDKIHAIEYITKMVSQPKTSYLITTSGRFYISNYQFSSAMVFINCETTAESGKVTKSAVRNVMIKDGVFKLIEEKKDGDWKTKAVNDSKIIEESKIIDELSTDSKSPSFKIMIVETLLDVENNGKFYIYGMIYPSTEERKLSDIGDDRSNSFYYLNRYSRCITPTNHLLTGLKFMTEETSINMSLRSHILAQLILENQSLPREIINSYIISLHDVNIPYFNFLVQHVLPIDEIFSEKHVTYEINYGKIASCKNILIIPVTTFNKEYFRRDDDEDTSHRTIYNIYFIVVNLYNMEILENLLIYEVVDESSDDYFIDQINDNTYTLAVKTNSHYDFLINRVNILDTDHINRISLGTDEKKYLGISSNEEIIFYDTIKNVFEFYSYETGFMKRNISVDTMIDSEPTVRMISKNFIQIKLRYKEIYMDLTHYNSYIFANSGYAIMNDKKLYIISTDLLSLTSTKEKTEVKVIATRQSYEYSSRRIRRQMYEYILENGFLTEYMGLYPSTPISLDIDTENIKFNGPLAIYRTYDEDGIYIRMFDDRTKESTTINRLEPERMHLLDHDFISEDQVYMTDLTKIYVYDYSKKTIVSRQFEGIAPIIIPNRYMFFRQNRENVIQYTPCNKKFTVVINEDADLNYIPLTCSKLLEYHKNTINIVC